MVAFFIYLIVCILVGVLAGRWGRIGFLWFLFSFLTTPLLAVLILLIVGKREDRSQKEVVKICPECLITIEIGAFVCWRCGYDFVKVIDVTENPSENGDEKYRNKHPLG